MAIDVTNFVNVNIDRIVKVAETGSRPEVMLFSASSKATLIGSNSDYTKFYDENYAEVTLKSADIPYAKYFFMNGGCKLTLTTDTLPTTAEEIKKLSTDVVILASVASISDKSVFDKLEGIYQKIFVYRVADNTSDKTSSNFLAYKVSPNAGAEMTIAAYLSQIKMYTNGSPVDYDFTKESLVTLEDHTNDLTFAGTDIVKCPYNFNIKIADNYYNIGGNSTNGEDLVEQFGLIVMQQDLTTALFKTLSSKISGQKGIAAIRTSIAETLDAYVNSGFLVNDKVWTDSDLVLPNKADSSKPNETVITKNTPITSGYYIHMFRLSSDYRKVYCVVIVATSKGIRYIVLDGKAI